MPSSRAELILDPLALRELAFVARIADQVPRIAETAAEVPVGGGFSAITQHVAERTGLPAADVERVLLSLQNLLRIRTRLHVSSEELFDQIADAYVKRSDEEDGQENAERWTAARGAILEVMEAIGPDHPVQVIRKVERLAYAHQSILTEARIITELRPVFNEAGDRIIQGIIVNTLLIDYFDGGQNRRLEIGLDATDVAEIRRISQRAEGKAVAIKEALRGLDWQTTIYPEESNR